jgi:hypothetical protein
MPNMRSVGDIMTLPNKNNNTSEFKYQENFPLTFSRSKKNDIYHGDTNTNRKYSLGIYDGKSDKRLLSKVGNQNNPIDISNSTDFPSLDNKITHNRQPKINYYSISNQETIETQKRSLFTNGFLLLSFNEIQKMYNSYAIFRIRLHYVVLNRKINILDTIDREFPDKGKYFKEVFGYNDLILSVKRMEICIMVWMLFNDFNLLNEKNTITKYLEKCNTILKTNNLEKIKNDYIYEEIKSLHIRCENIINLMSNCLQKYLSVFRDLSEFTQIILNDIFTLKNISHLMEKMVTIRRKIMDINHQIIMDNDPHIECDYYVQLSAKHKFNIIRMLAISSLVFIRCDSPIDLSTKNKKIDPKELYDITEEKLRNYFNKRINSDDYYINLDMRFCTSPFPKIRYLNIYYCIDEEIPNEKIFVKITDLPKNVHVLASVLYNRKLEKKIDVPPIPKKNKLWLNDRSQVPLSVEEYETLDPQIKKYYKREDTSKNIFTVDYLFNSLITEDRNNNNTFIKPIMLDSFRDLAIQTSYRKFA